MVDVQMEGEVVSGSEDARDAVVFGRVDRGNAEGFVEQ